MEENANKLHFKCTNFNSFTHVTVNAECIYVDKWVLSYGFCSNFYTLSSSAKMLKIGLRFDKVTESLKVGTFLDTV